MNRDHAVGGVLSLVVLTAILSGPLVGMVDLTAADDADLASVDLGTATVSNASLPSQARFTRSTFGTESVYLEVPPATVDVESVNQRVHFSYQISIDALGYTRGTTHFIGPRHVGPHNLTIERRAFDPDRLTGERYDAELTITLYESTGETSVAERNITVAVDR
jgi:hypothetical protein